MIAFDINDAIGEIVVLLSGELQRHNVSLETALSGGPTSYWATVFSCSR
ncbi:MAG: hypothetical protein WDN49_07155 [Acetobacteraceae bacterium]